MKDKISSLLKKGILLSPDILDKPEIADGDLIEKAKNASVVVFDSNISSLIQQDKYEKINWREYDKHKAENESAGKKNDIILEKNNFNSPEKELRAIQKIEHYEDINKKKTIMDFVNLYNERFLILQSILKQRQELQSAISIRKLDTMLERENVSLIGMVYDISVTKNNNIMLTLEDPTGTVKVMIMQKNKESYDLAKEITPDEVIGLQGAKGDKIIFANNIIFPDIPLSKELKKSPIDETAIFISDLHIGSKVFLKENFNKFISWLKGDYSQQQEKPSKIKYLFILGDIVEGIGIFPGQEDELEIKDIYEQYKTFCGYAKQIPSDIEVIICPGNHDSIRISEPQPPLSEYLINEISNLPNVHLVSSPSIVKVGETKNFSGFDILIYHGFSFPYYATSIESLRLQGGLENTDNIMTYLLKKRHLAPTHGSTQYQLGYKGDPLAIKALPDFFVSGHIHRASIKNYRNITMLNCSCWITQTDYQEKRGLVPIPAKAICVNLKTREAKMLSFD